MASVYALYSCRNGLVRYVGMTIGTADRRFDLHRRWHHDGSGVVRDWMFREWGDGFPVRIEVLERCESSQVGDRETYWMNLFDNLLNQRKYFRPGLPPHRRLPTPKVPAIAKYVRNHTFNFEGRLGIHYRHSIDMYFVLVPDRDEELRPLIGDELPGGSRAMWFSDLARANNARDRYRDICRKYWPEMQWPCDKVI